MSSDSMPGRKKILVVDDEIDIVTLIKMRLSSKGYEVITAHDGHEALSQVQRHTPDLVIADLNMPHLDGWRLSQKIRDNEKFKTIPIILLSSLVEKEGPAGDLEVGDFYMTKPFEPEALLAKIKELLKEE